jgi:hypothetical protein
VGEIPLVPCRPRRGEVLPGDPGPRGPLAVAFAAIPAPVPAPGNGQTVGIDRGVAVSAALSTGDLLYAPREPQLLLRSA